MCLPLAGRCHEARPRAIEPAEQALRFGVRCGGRKSGADELLDAQLEMESDLLVDVAVAEPRAADREAEIDRRIVEG